MNLVKGDPASRHLYAVVVWDIKDLLNRAWRVELHHSLREGNACADYMAKFGASQDEALVVVETPLVGLSQLLVADALGITSLRH